MAKLPSPRASDSDREQVAERLRCATAEGRLSAKELEERLEGLFAARTYGELDALLADLPVGRWPRRERIPAAHLAGAVGGALALAVLARLAIRRGHSGAAAVAVAGYRQQVTFRASASLQPAWPVAGQALLSRELWPHRAVAAGFIETELLLGPTSSRLVS